MCKASRQTATTVLMIKKLLDVSDIQTYSINGQRIVYISQRQSNEKHNPKVIGRKCEICGWSNLSSSVKFCSVECKVSAFGGTALLSINSFYYFKGKLTRKAFFLPGTGRLGK